MVDTIATELGLETVPVWASMMGLAVRGTKLTNGPVESYPFRLPLSISDRVAFAMRGLKVPRAVAAGVRGVVGVLPRSSGARALRCTVT